MDFEAFCCKGSYVNGQHHAWSLTGHQGDGPGLALAFGASDTQLSWQLGVCRGGLAQVEKEGNKEGHDAVTQTSKGEKGIRESLSGRAGQGERPVWNYLG